jgi:hypothetical protein
MGFHRQYSHLVIFGVAACLVFLVCRLWRVSWEALDANRKARDELEHDQLHL